MVAYLSVMFLCITGVCDFIYSNKTFNTVEECKQLEAEYTEQFKAKGISVIGTACIPVKLTQPSVAHK